jgi:hypothetical protein
LRAVQAGAATDLLTETPAGQEHPAKVLPEAMARLTTWLVAVVAVALEQ